MGEVRGEVRWEGTGKGLAWRVGGKGKEQRGGAGSERVPGSPYFGGEKDGKIKITHLVLRAELWMAWPCLWMKPIHCHELAE